MWGLPTSPWLHFASQWSKQSKLYSCILQTTKKGTIKSALECKQFNTYDTGRFLVCLHLSTAVSLVSSISHIDSSLFASDFCLPLHFLVSRPSQLPPSSRTCWVWYAGAQALWLMVRGAPIPPPPPHKPPTFPCRVSIRLALYLTFNYMYVCAHGCHAIGTVHNFLYHIWKICTRHIQYKTSCQWDKASLVPLSLLPLSCYHLMSVGNMTLLIYLVLLWSQNFCLLCIKGFTFKQLSCCPSYKQYMLTSIVYMVHSRAYCHHHIP